MSNCKLICKHFWQFVDSADVAIDADVGVDVNVDFDVDVDDVVAFNNILIN